MTPQEAIAKLKTLPEDQQRQVLEQLTPDEREGIMKQLSAPVVTIGAAPPKGSFADIKGRAMTARDWMVNQLPSVGGFLGGLVGLGAGAETGPGALISSTAGAAAGGGLGEDARQALTEQFHPEDKRMSPGEAALRMLVQSTLQGANQAGGHIVGSAVGKVANAVGQGVAERMGPTASKAALQKYPFLKDFFAFGEPKAAQHLTSAAATKQTAGPAFEAITKTLGDIEDGITKLPKNEQTVEGFLNAVNLRKDAMNLESGVALMPIKGQQIVPTGVAQSIQDLAQKYDPAIPGDRAIIKYINSKAAEWQHPISYGALDLKRSRLASDLAKFKAKGPVAKYTAEKGDIDLAIDNAIEGGLRDTVYPAMDAAAGKPTGYFADLKGRQSNLITLQSILDKRLQDLKGAQAISEAVPPLSRENVSIYAHPGGMPRAVIHGARDIVSPARELNAANAHVGKAFEPSVDALPYQVLFTGLGRIAQLKGPKTQQLEDAADEQRSVPVQ